MTAEPIETTESVLRTIFTNLRERLPTSWEVRRNDEAVAVTVLEVSAAGGQTARFAISCSVTLSTDNALRKAADEAESNASRLGALPLVASRFLDEAQQDQLARRSINYADGTGNVRITADDPAMFLASKGASKDPWRGSGRPKGRLSGTARAKLIRALVDFLPPYTIPELMKAADTKGANAAYALIDYLFEVGLVEQRRPNKPRGEITDVDWRGLLVAWSQDYGFLASNAVARYLQPRGMERFLSDLKSVDEIRYAVTGSLAAARIAPYAEPRAAMIYCDDPAALAAAMKLRPSQAGANVLLAGTRYESAYQRSTVIDGVTYAAASQVAVDLLNGPGRSREEAEYLMDWMGENIDQWRISGYGPNARGAA